MKTFITSLLVLSLSGSANAGTRLVLDSGATPVVQQGWVDRALVTTPDITVTLDPHRCSDSLACASPGVISIAPEFESPLILLHELGHQLDYSRGDGWPVRRHWLAIMHQNRPWGEIGAAHAGYPNPPREQFAESFAHCAIRSRFNKRELRDGVTAGYNWRPTRFQYAKICDALKARP